MAALTRGRAIEHGTVNKNPLAMSDHKPFWACVENLSSVLDQHVWVSSPFPHQCVFASRQGIPLKSTYGVGSSGIIVTTLLLDCEGGLREEVTMSGNIVQQCLPTIEVKVCLVPVECFEVSSVVQCRYEVHNRRIEVGNWRK